MIEPQSQSSIIHQLNDINSGNLHIVDFLEQFKSQFDLFVIGLNEEGPEIRYGRQLPWFEEEVDEDYLVRFALDTVILALREQYADTVADLPVPDSSDWRAIVFSINMNNSHLPDHENFLQFILLIPVAVHKELQSSSLWQKEIIELIKSMVSVDSVFDRQIVENLKQKILYHLLTNVKGRLY